MPVKFYTGWKTPQTIQIIHSLSEFTVVSILKMISRSRISFPNAQQENMSTSVCLGQSITCSVMSVESIRAPSSGHSW